MATSVIIVQISEDQERLWQAVLESQGLEVTIKSPQEDITQYLKELKQSGKQLPSLVLMDMGVTTRDSSSLQAVGVCRWCAETKSGTQVILNNSKQDQILPLKRRWATRLGAADLLPRLFSENLTSVIDRVAEVVGFKVSLPALQQIFDFSIQAESEDTTVMTTQTESRNLREVKTDEIVRKLAALTSTINEVYADDTTEEEQEQSSALALDATIQELTLYDFYLDVSRPGNDATRFLEENTLIPGVILVKDDKYFGFLSRRRILEMLARPFGQELFVKRPLATMYDAGALDTMILPGTTPRRRWRRKRPQTSRSIDLRTDRGTNRRQQLSHVRPPRLVVSPARNSRNRLQDAAQSGKSADGTDGKDGKSGTNAGGGIPRYSQPRQLYLRQRGISAKLLGKSDQDSTNHASRTYFSGAQSTNGRRKPHLCYARPAQGGAWHQIRGRATSQPSDWVAEFFPHGRTCARCVGCPRMYRK